MEKREPSKQKHYNNNKWGSKFSYKNKSKQQPKKNNQDSSQKIIFSYMNDKQMGVKVSYKLINDNYKSLIKSAHGTWDPDYKIWKIPRENYTFLRTQMPLVNPQILFEDPPDLVDRAVRQPSQTIILKKQKIVIAYSKKDKQRDIKNNPIYHKLYPFQRQSLALSVKKYGRLLIADEMGVGKTLQSLACALQFRQQWPLLIISPSALKLTWLSQIQKWYKENNILYKQQIQILSRSNNIIRFNQIKVLICSYDIASKLTDQLNGFKVVIVDQAHYLKNSTAQRSLILIPFLSSRKRIFLLTGTPALAKPRQLFNLASIIRPDVFYDIKQFGDRYCALQRNPWTGAMEYQGCRNANQLYYILKDKIMIRRLKSEVLQDLPPKQRQSITIQTDKAIVKEIRQLLNQEKIQMNLNDTDNQKMIQQFLSKAFGHKNHNSDEYQQQGGEKKYTERTSLTKCFQLSGMAKIQGVKEYIKAIMQNDVKILIFAHHRVVLDQLQSYINQKLKIKYIRIDGSVLQQTRHKRVKMFQEQIDIRIAILSIAAAGVGYTLTSASTVIFAQLHWTPAMMIQAEDRAHRIGQKYSVNIHYLLGQNTLDLILYKILEKKFKIVGQILDGKSKKMDMQDIEKGAIGRLHVLQDSYSQESSINNNKQIKKISTKSKLTDYFNNINKKSEQSQEINKNLNKPFQNIFSLNQKMESTQKSQQKNYDQEQQQQQKLQQQIDEIQLLIRKRKAELTQRSSLQDQKKRFENRSQLELMRMKKQKRKVQ